MLGFMQGIDSFSMMQLYQWRNASPEAKAFIQAIDEKRKSVSAEKKKFFSLRFTEAKDYTALRDALAKGQKPSEFFERHMAWMFGPYILPRHREAFLWAADHCLDRPYTLGWARRPLRSTLYVNYVRLLCDNIIRQFSDKAVVDADICDILSGHLPPDALAFARECEAGYCPEIIAYELNRGNEQLKALLSACLDGDEGAPKPSRAIFLGILLSNDAELHAHLGRLLLAARLQEGLRQSICECADEGTLAGFQSILRVIADNDLLRYSSVKRAVGVWTGVLSPDTNDLERVSGKTLALLLEGLKSPEQREAMLREEDSLKIYMGLWSEAVLDVSAAVRKAQSLIENGSQHQALVCGFFASSLQNLFAYHLLAKAALRKWPKDQEVLALYLPGFLDEMNLKAFLEAKSKTRSLSPYFDSIHEGGQFYALLKAQYDALKGKEKVFAPCVFPWYAAALRKSALAETICELAAMLGEADIMDDALPLVSQVDTYRRSGALEALLTPLKRPAQRAALMDALADKSAVTRKTAFEIAEKALPADLDFAVIEGHLRLKAADARMNCIKLLMRQEDGAVMDTVKRLLSDPQEEKRAAAYDLISLIASDANRTRLKPACAELLQAHTPIGPKESILWDGAMQAVRPEEKRENPLDALFTEADAFQPDLSFFDSEIAYQEAFSALFPDSQIIQGKPGIVKKIKALLSGDSDCPSRVQARQDAQTLDALIDAHREDSIGNDPVGTEKDQLLGYGHLRPFWFYQQFPCASVWEAWYASLGGIERLARVILLLYAEASPSGDIIDRLMGAGFSRPEKMQYREQMVSVCAYLFQRYAKYEWFYLAAMRAVQWTVLEAPEAQFAMKTGENKTWCVTHSMQLGWLLSFLMDAPDKEWARCFHARAALWQRYNQEYIPLLRSQMRKPYPWYESQRPRPNMTSHGLVGQYRYNRNGGGITPTPLEELRAAYQGVMTERALLQGYFQPENLKSAMTALSQLSLYFHTQRGEVRGPVGRGWDRLYRSSRVPETAEALTGKKQADFTDEDHALIQYADGIYEKLLPLILDSEIRRGENEGPFSACILGIQYIRGTDWLGRLLAALGKESLARSTWQSSYAQHLSRKDSLCHLLSVCLPAQEDSADALGRMAQEYKISRQRLFETAMYNPAWAERLEEYLHLPGFTSAVYYFIAHMNERFDEARMALIARFTPLTADELNAGAFDIAWFRSAWEQVGEETFDQLYAAAKYITDGAKHSRARKYADASLGRLTVEETEAQIKEKRNKDLLMAYPLIPLSGDQDTLRRFLFIQQFLKESRQFGAQRSASERKACEMALKNLAANSGDRDVTRLTLRMDGQLTESSLPLFDPQPVEDVTLRLEMDAEGGVAIVCEKDGKRLKSVPARLKKNEALLRLTEAKKELSQQYSRTRTFLEDAMTEETFLTGAELAGLRKNPIARALADRIIFKAGDHFGLPCEEGLQDEKGTILPWSRCAAAQIAHPFHLFEANIWHDWQASLFRQKIRQPFKQAFRELYVKTADELGRTDSLRYAGYQIQPQKAAAALKTRRWVADMETGLQKVFYQKNVVAVLYAQADWFTPADMEAPALEAVGFFERLTGKPLKTDDLPDVLFSEIMRDIDLAVSVAHVGGVDPQISHSTIQMRTALLEFTLPLFGISNVRIEKNHALIQGKRAAYTVHLGSGVIHQQGGAMLQIVAVHSQHRGKLFLPFLDDDPQTAEILTKVLFLAQDQRIQDPNILAQIR